MTENRGFDILDYLLIISKWKKVIISSIIVSGIITYLAIYFLIPARYDATAIILPSEQDQMSAVGSFLKSFSNLPVSIPGLKNSNNDIYKTIIYSRTMLEKLINKFDLVKEYNRKTFDDVLEDAAGYISADENKEGAYEIKVRSISPQKAADMANFLVEELNKTVIEMNVQKSKDNRQFLEKRYDEIKKNLRVSEDSLTRFQKTSGILLAEEQTKASIEAYTKMEADLMSKQSEVAILKKVYGEDSPQIKNAVIALDEYNRKLENLKKGKENTDLLMAIKNLPANGMTYVRLFREVTIYNKMLEFIIPLYEQVRFEEQKNIPVLQIVDHAKAPEKRAYPKRFIVTVIVVVIVFFLTLFSIILREVVVNSSNPKVLSLRKSLRLRG